MQFEKYVFSTGFNDLSIAKYSNDNGNVLIQIEDHNGKSKQHESASFTSEDEYETWLDSITDENDQHYNKARAVSDVLAHLYI